MKIGIIFTAYNMASFVERSLSPWIHARHCKMDGNEYVISASSCPFSGFPSQRIDDTSEILHGMHSRHEIDYLLLGNDEKPETDSRTFSLKLLLSRECDVVMQVDADEIYTTEQISGIFKFVSDNPDMCWFSGCLKNYVFNEKTYLAEPFRPPRIHRTKFLAFSALSFYDDNNIEYTNGYPRPIKDVVFCNNIIPQSVAWTDHFTWLDNERSRQKVEYQKARGWECSFDWDYSSGHLKWNDKFLAKNGSVPPDLRVIN